MGFWDASVGGTRVWTAYKNDNAFWAEEVDVGDAGIFERHGHFVGNTSKVHIREMRLDAC